MDGWGSEHVLKGKIVVVVDDSIVRGTTARQLVGLIYAAGAKEVRPHTTRHDTGGAADGRCSRQPHVPLPRRLGVSGAVSCGFAWGACCQCCQGMEHDGA